jgi:ABC-type Fe3+-hydroxamate transport system substrate-binding protein
MQTRYFLLFVAALTVSGCGTRSSATVTPGKAAARTGEAAATKTKQVSDIVLTEGDLDTPYMALGDIEVTVSKWTIFDSDPTREKVAEALREKAAGMGADAVVFVRYGTVGVSMMSWGSMDGRGRAVVFK